MKSWQKGAILGGTWGLISIIPYSKIPHVYPFWMKFLYILLGIPTNIAITVGFHFYFVFIGAPLVGALIGALLGYISEKQIRRS